MYPPYIGSYMKVVADAESVTNLRSLTLLEVWLGPLWKVDYAKETLLSETLEGQKKKAF